MLGTLYCKYSKVWLTFSLLKNVWVVCTLELLQVKVLETFVSRFLSHILFNSLGEMATIIFLGQKCTFSVIGSCQTIFYSDFAFHSIISNV